MRYGRLPRTFGVAAITLCLSAWAPAGLQTVALDEGSFRLLVDGREVGRETFSIRQSGTGADVVIVAQGRVVMDTDQTAEEVTTSLELAGPRLRAVAYQINVRGPAPESITGRMTGNRFTARIVSPAGERMREYLVSEGAVITDDGVAHHHHFVGRRLEVVNTSIMLIVPRQSLAQTARVSQLGTETLELNGARRQARRLLIEPAHAPARHLWLDEDGRVLRLEIPDRNYVAERIGL